MRVLILANTGLGDHISSTIPLARKISNFKKVHCITHNVHGYNIMRSLSCFESCIISENIKIEYLNGEIDKNRIREKLTDLAKTFILYETVYVPFSLLYQRLFELVDNCLLHNVFVCKEVEPCYRPEMCLSKFGFKDFDISIDINIFDKYYKNFFCNKNSILLNGKSNCIDRDYKKINELGEILSSFGFDVRFLDSNDDIRHNIHLINQVSQIITTDTSILWLAKALKKKHYVFLAKTAFLNNRDALKILGVKNLIPNDYEYIEDIPPAVISSMFLKKQIRHI